MGAPRVTSRGVTSRGPPPPHTQPSPLCPPPLPQSEEDKQLQDELEMLVERLGVSARPQNGGIRPQINPPPNLTLKRPQTFQEKDTSLYRPALEELRRQIRSSTTSMTSVPKPLKFLRPHYGKLKEIYESMAPGENKVSDPHRGRAFAPGALLGHPRVPGV